MYSADTSPQAEEIQLEALRKMGPEKRLAAGVDLILASLDLVRAGIAARHPEYGREQRRLALIRTILPEALFIAAYPGADQLLDAGK